MRLKTGFVQMGHICKQFIKTTNKAWIVFQQSFNLSIFLKLHSFFNLEYIGAFRILLDTALQIFGSVQQIDNP